MVMFLRSTPAPSRSYSIRGHTATRRPRTLPASRRTSPLSSMLHPPQSQHVCGVYNSRSERTFPLACREEITSVSCRYWPRRCRRWPGLHTRHTGTRSSFAGPNRTLGFDEGRRGRRVRKAYTKIPTVLSSVTTTSLRIGSTATALKDAYVRILNEPHGLPPSDRIVRLGSSRGDRAWRLQRLR